MFTWYSATFLQCANVLHLSDIQPPALNIASDVDVPNLPPLCLPENFKVCAQKRKDAWAARISLTPPTLSLSKANFKTFFLFIFTVVFFVGSVYLLLQCIDRDCENKMRHLQQPALKISFGSDHPQQQPHQLCFPGERQKGVRKRKKDQLCKDQLCFPTKIEKE